MTGRESLTTVVTEESAASTAESECLEQEPTNRQWYQHLFVEMHIMDCQREIRSPLFWTEVLMEAVTSVLLGCFNVWMRTTLDDKFYVPSAIAMAMFAGIYVCVMVDATGPYDYAMFNPIVSWGFFLNGRMSPVRMIIYQAAQFSGVVAGAMLAVWLTPDNVRLALKPVPLSSSLTPFQGGLIEAIISFNLVFVSLSITMSNSKNNVIPGLTIGLAVFIGLLVAGTRTGGLLSPSLSLAYAVTSKNFSNLWAYWIGEYAGATVASLFSKVIVIVRSRHMPEDDQQTSVVKETPPTDNESYFDQSSF